MKEICLGKRINISIKPPRHFVPPLRKNGGEFPMKELTYMIYVDPLLITENQPPFRAGVKADFQE